MDKTNKMMREMFRLQNTLNNQTNGENWIGGITKEGRKINWKRCIYIESVELTDSLNWKHWKNLDKPDDIENAKIELVDIWHFIMSDMIAAYSFKFGVDEVAKIAAARYKGVAEEDKKWETKTLLEISEEITKSAICGGMPIREFFCAINATPDFSFEDVYRLYIGKNCLNQFRQDHGYKDGTYVKKWNGEEDNVYMQKIIEESSDISYDALYTKLEEKYQKYNGEDKK